MIYMLDSRKLRMLSELDRLGTVGAVAKQLHLTAPGVSMQLSTLEREVGVTLTEMLGGLELALDRERRFIADASHEVRTPLALLRTELELALRRPRSNDELEQSIRSAAWEVDRLSLLAEDMLVLAQADGGELPVRREQISVLDLLDRLRIRFEADAATAGRTIVLGVVAPGLTLLADRRRVEQALGNLADNALRHGQGTVVLSACQTASSVELHVRDEGHFPDDLRSRAFERFARSDAARSRSGAGLGLAIVDVIARSHGGSAHIANDGETDVWLALPDH